jgi:type IV pilus biogenesis protein CpaD/CtpE
MPLILRIALLGIAAALLTGCAESLPTPPLPDFGRIKEKVLTPAEQEKAIKDMANTQQKQEAQAVKTIETTKPK